MVILGKERYHTSLKFRLGAGFAKHIQGGMSCSKVGIINSCVAGKRAFCANNCLIHIN